MSYSLHSYKLNSGAQHICILQEPERQTKWLKILVMRDKPLSVERVTTSEREHMRPIEYKGKPYPLKRALKHFRKFAKAHGSNKAARKFIREAKAS